MHWRNNTILIARGDGMAIAGIRIAGIKGCTGWGRGPAQGAVAFGIEQTVIPPDAVNPAKAGIHDRNFLISFY